MLHLISEPLQRRGRLQKADSAYSHIGARRRPDERLRVFREAPASGMAGVENYDAQLLACARPTVQYCTVYSGQFSRVTSREQSPDSSAPRGGRLYSPTRIRRRLAVYRADAGAACTLVCTKGRRVAAVCTKGLRGIQYGSQERYGRFTLKGHPSCGGTVPTPRGSLERHAALGDPRVGAASTQPDHFCGHFLVATLPHASPATTFWRC